MGNDTPHRNLFEGAALVVAAGALFGLVAAMLEVWGNPANMGICVVCFERDIVGGLGLHDAAPLRYLRREIMGIFPGAFLSALFTLEFRARGRPRFASDPSILYGVFASIGALVFMGCTWRMLCRLSGLDLTALVGLAGLVAGVGLGGWFQHRGYQPPALVARHTWGGFLWPAVMLAAGTLRTPAAGPQRRPLKLPRHASRRAGVHARRRCSARQIVLAAEGNLSAAEFVVAAFLGVWIAHLFPIAALPDRVVEGSLVVGGPPVAGQAVVLGGIVLCAILGLRMRRRTGE